MEFPRDWRPDSWHFKKIPMVLVQIHDVISIGGVKIPSKMCRNSRGEGKKVDVLYRGGVRISNAISQFSFRKEIFFPSGGNARLTRESRTRVRYRA